MTLSWAPATAVGGAHERSSAGIPCRPILAGVLRTALDARCDMDVLAELMVREDAQRREILHRLETLDG